MKKRVTTLFGILLFTGCGLVAQDVYSLQKCVEYALINNHNIKKSQYDLEKSGQARKEVTGALLPQLNGTGSLNNNIQKSKFIMPNFINSMLPPAMQDPDAAKYMTIEMGTNYSAGIGATLNQQLVNFSLFNAVDIAKTAQSLTALSVESKEEDVIAQTANIYYAIQVTEYAVGLMGKSISIIDTMLNTMEVSYANGLIKKVDLDRLKVTRVNVQTQQSAVINATEVQKNLLKLQMGLDMDSNLATEKLDISSFDNKLKAENNYQFDLATQTPYKILSKQQSLIQLQRRSALYESLPVLTAMATFNYNGVSDEFFKGETNYWYPSSMVGLNLRIPIFGGLSRSAKVKEADYEMLKVNEDVAVLEQSLNMVYKNALMKIEDTRKTIMAQRENMKLAEDVYNISKNNYSQGLASMSDVLNASSSLIQSQISYADAMNNYMKAYIDLRKANGTIRSIVE